MVFLRDISSEGAAVLPQWDFSYDQWLDVGGFGTESGMLNYGKSM
jgi:hypothetical protein